MTATPATISRSHKTYIRLEESPQECRIKKPSTQHKRIQSPQDPQRQPDKSATDKLKPLLLAGDYSFARGPTKESKRSPSLPQASRCTGTSSASITVVLVPKVYVHGASMIPPLNLFSVGDCEAKTVVVYSIVEYYPSRRPAYTPPRSRRMAAVEVTWDEAMGLSVGKSTLYRRALDTACKALRSAPPVDSCFESTTAHWHATGTGASALYLADTRKATCSWSR